MVAQKFFKRPNRILHDLKVHAVSSVNDDTAERSIREEAYEKLSAAIRNLGYVTELLEKREATLESLRRLLCHASTEKTETVLQQAGIDGGEQKSSAGEGPPRAPKRKSRGHGRHAAAAYSRAQKVKVPHTLKAGDACPAGCGRKVYPQREPGLLVRINPFDYLSEHHQA